MGCYSSWHLSFQLITEVLIMCHCPARFAIVYHNCSNSNGKPSDMAYLSEGLTIACVVIGFIMRYSVRVC